MDGLYLAFVIYIISQVQLWTLIFFYISLHVIPRIMANYLLTSV